MEKAHMPGDHEGKFMKANIQDRFKKIFSDPQSPVQTTLREARKLEAPRKQQEDRALPVREPSQNFAPSVSTNSAAGKGDSWFTRLWNVLTGAHPSIQELRERSAARLAASFLFIILLLEITGAVARGPNLGLINALSVQMVSLVPTLLAYVLSRTKWYRGAIFIFSFFFGSLAYTTMIREGAGADISTLLLVYVPLSLIVASTFLSSWAVFVLLGLNLGAFILTSQFGIPATPENFGAQSGIIITIGMVLILLANFRNRSEQQTVQEIRTVNEEIQLANTELLLGREQLEQRVAERTHDLELATEVGRSVSEKIGDLTEMLSQSVELIRAKYELYYTQIYLADAAGRSLILRAGTGPVGAELLRRGHRLEVSQASLNGRAASDRQPMVVPDTQESENFLPNPLLPRTRSELAVPLIVNDKVVGILDMQSEKPGTFGAASLPAFQVLSSQLAVAIQNATLFNQTQEARLVVEEQARRLTRSGWQDFINAIERSETIGYVFHENELLPLAEAQDASYASALTVPIQIAGAQVGEIQLGDDSERTWTSTEKEIIQSAALRVGQHIENLRLLAQAEEYRSEAEQAARRLTREGWESFLKSRKKLERGYVYDLHQVQAWTENTNGGHPTIAQPIVVQDETLGELAVAAQAGLTQESAEIVAAVAEQLSGHIENLRLLEQNEKRASEMATVATVSTTASTLLDPDQLLRSVVNLTKERLGLYHAHIYLLSPEQEALVLTAGAGEVGEQMLVEGWSIPASHELSIIAESYRRRQSVVANDVIHDRESTFLSNRLLPHTRSEMALPLIVGERVLGVFDVQSEEVHHFTEENVNIFTTLASQVAVALQNARLYREQAALVTQLRELDKLKSSFLANMSHELRTPLNSILGFTDVIMEGLDGPLTDHMDNDLRLIHKNGQHLLHLINDVLDMAKIDAGRMNLIPETFKALEVMEEVTSITSTLATEKNLAVTMDDASDAEIQIYADRTRLRQVMINLVNNAIKFTEAGTISLKVIALQGARILISVKDTGIGIAPDQLAAVFQEFTQVDISTTRKAGGTGLGLPISRRLVEMHGGRLWAESTGIAGEGSTFFVELPLEARITEVVEKQAA